MEIMGVDRPDRTYGSFFGTQKHHVFQFLDVGIPKICLSTLPPTLWISMETRGWNNSFGRDTDCAQRILHRQGDTQSHY